VVPTLAVFYAFSDSVTDVGDLPIGERLAQLPKDMRDFFEQGAATRTPASRDRSRQSYLLAAAVGRRVREFGGVIGAGSDSPAGVYNIPGGALHRELELLVREGMPPLEAIHAATGAAAKILGRPDLGTIRPGSVADLVVVAGNPAEEVRATRRIRAVIQAGRTLPMDSLFPPRKVPAEPTAH
jgi:imidazolonepropionase-like amidohydrolase